MTIFYVFIFFEEEEEMQTEHIFWRNRTYKEPGKSYIPNTECKQAKKKKKTSYNRKIRAIIRVSSFSMPIDFVPVLEWTKFLIYVIVIFGFKVCH